MILFIKIPVRREDIYLNILTLLCHSSVVSGPPESYHMRRLALSFVLAFAGVGSARIRPVSVVSRRKARNWTQKGTDTASLSPHGEGHIHQEYLAVQEHAPHYRANYLCYRTELTFYSIMPYFCAPVKKVVEFSTNMVTQVINLCYWDRVFVIIIIYYYS